MNRFVSCFLIALLLATNHSNIALAADDNSSLVETFALEKNVTAGKQTTLTLHSKDIEKTAGILLSPASASLKKTLSLSAQINDVVIIEQLAYVAADHSGLFIINLSNNNNQALLRTRLSVGDQVLSLKVHAQHAYLAAKGGMYIIDISDPNAPQTISYYRTSGAVTALSISSSNAGILTSKNKLLVLDISKPEKPRLRSAIQLDGPAHNLSIIGSNVFVANDINGLLVFNIRDDQPINTAHYQTTGAAFDIAVKNNIAYLANGDNGLTILDVSNTDKIRWLGSHQQLGDARKIQLTKHQAWLQNTAGHTLRLDVSSPNMPSIISAFRSPLTPLGSGNFTIVGDILYATNKQNLSLYNVSSTAPQISNEALDFGQGVNFGGQRRIFIKDELAYVADWFSGLHIYDISSPERPRLLSTFHTDGSSKGVIVRDDHAFVADDDHGLQIINVKDPRQPFRVSQVQTPGLAYIPILDGDRLYLASHRGGFQIIDISDLSNPTIIGQQNSSGKTWGIQVKNNYVYIADDDAGLMIFDVSDSQHIKMLGQFNPGGDAEDVLLDGNLAYVAFFENGVFILDISDPGFPRQLAHISTPGNARGLALLDQHLYVADWLSGVQVINVQQPKHARIVGSYDSKGAAWGLAIKNHQAYIMDWWGGFTVLDINLPQQPHLAGQYINPQTVLGYAAHENVLYAAWANNGLQVFDITNPLNPTWMTGVDMPASTIDVALWKNYAYLALSNKRIAVVDISNPHQSNLVRIFRSSRDIKRLRANNGQLLMAANDGSLTLYNLNNPEKPKTKKRIKAELLDFDINAQQQLITSGTEGIRLYDLSNKKPHLRYTLNSPGALIRIHEHTVYQYNASSSSIAVFKVLTDKLQPIATIPVGDLLDMQIADQTLTLIESDSVIKQIDISKPSSWRYKTRYQTLGNISAVLPHKTSLYLAGDQSIIALQPLPDSSISRTDKHNIKLTVSAEMPVGDYELLLQQTTQQTTPLATFSVNMASFSKPRLSLEDLKKIMEEKLNLPSEQMQSH